jgi:hypothetical protein
MAQYLLWAEAVLKLGSGLILLLFPVSSPRLFGLPATAGPFWTRLLAAVLCGMGLGLAGSMAINLTAAAVVAGQLVVGRAAATRRGALTLWALVITLTGISLVELAYI